MARFLSVARADQSLTEQPLQIRFSGDCLYALVGRSPTLRCLDPTNLKLKYGISLSPAPAGMTAFRISEKHIEILAAKDSRLHVFGKDGRRISTKVLTPEQARDFKSVTLDDQRLVGVQPLNSQVSVRPADHSEALTTIGKFGIRPGFFMYPKDVAPSGPDEVFVADSYLGIVQVFSLSKGKLVSIVSGASGLPHFWQHPISIAFDPKTRLLAVADLAENSVTLWQDAEESIQLDDHYLHQLVKGRLKSTHSLENVCIQCHDSSVTGELQYYTGMGQHPIKDKVYCGSCHTPHTSMSNGNFLRKGIQDNSLCIECHAASKTLSQHPLVSLSSHATKEVACSSCHSMHKGKDAHLVRTSDGPSLCKSCHTDQFDPNLNHSVAEEKMKSKEACGICHSPHAGEASTKLLHPLSNTATGCLKCHAEKKSVIASAHGHDLKFPGRETAVHACGSCHELHGNSTKQKLRVAPTLATAGPNLDQVSRSCLSCHAAGKDDLQRRFQHVTPLIFKKIPQLKDEIALFNKKGLPMGQEIEGYLGCTSCHDPHGGDGGKSSKTGFLRNYEKVIPFCTSCHETEGLPRYKFFHSGEYRKHAK